MRVLRILPRADLDIDEATGYYATEAGVETALRFLDATERAFEFILDNSAAGSPGRYRSDKLEGIRRWPVPGYKDYLVFYRVTEAAVEIVRVLHGARDVERIFEAEE